MSGAHRQEFGSLLAKSESEGSEDQRRERDRAATSHHMIDRHLWSAIDPTLELGDIHRVGNKEDPEG
jgi:hypothetical protein